MLVEKITVTTSPTSVYDLIKTARPTKSQGVSSKCKTITFKYAAAETKVVLLSDADTTTPITLLDNAMENIRAASIDDFSITEALLSVAADTVLVDIIISESLT